MLCTLRAADGSEHTFKEEAVEAFLGNLASLYKEKRAVLIAAVKASSDEDGAAFFSQEHSRILSSCGWLVKGPQMAQRRLTPDIQKLLFMFTEIENDTVIFRVPDIEDGAFWRRILNIMAKWDLP